MSLKDYYLGEKMIFVNLNIMSNTLLSIKTLSIIELMWTFWTAVNIMFVFDSIFILSIDHVNRCIPNFLSNPICKLLFIVGAPLYAHT